MPKELEKSLRKSGRKKGLRGRRLDRYVYGSQPMQSYFNKKRKKGRK